MARELNFEAEPLSNEQSYGEEISGEFQVRDHRVPQPARPAFRSAPGVFRAGGRPFGGTPFRPRTRFASGFGSARPFGSRSFGFRRRHRWPWLRGFGFTPFGAGITAPTTGVSELIAWAQGCLAQISGQAVPQDGILGPETRQAIATFQSQQQLAATGVLDAGTVAALQAACADQGGVDAGGAGV